MKFLYTTFKTFTKFEFGLWLGSLALILLSFFLSGNGDWLTLTASLVGGTALILVSKGNVLGQILTVVFSVLYGIISYTFRYYGEMITYLGMTAPIAVASVVTWLRNRGSLTEVRVIAGVPAFAAGRYCGHVRFLLYFKGVPHQLSAPEHAFRTDKFSGVLSDHAQKPLLCTGLCGKRSDPDFPVDPGRPERSRLPSDGDLLSRVPCQRCLRFCALVKSREEPDSRPSLLTAATCGTSSFGIDATQRDLPIGSVPGSPASVIHPTATGL